MIFAKRSMFPEHRYTATSAPTLEENNLSLQYKPFIKKFCGAVN
jgi:hypothetical protein